MYLVYRYWILFNTLGFISAAPSSAKNSEIYHHNPLVLTKCRNDHYEFPARARINPIDQKPEYFLIKDKDERYFCPDNEKIQKMQDPSQDYEQQKYCVFEKVFKKNEKKKCKNEVKPLIVENTKPMMSKRSNRDRVSRRLYDFVYKVCPNVSLSARFWSEIGMRKKFFPITNDQLPRTYQIYYDHSENRVIYTKHRIMAPYIFKNLRLVEEKAAVENISEKYLTEKYGLENLENLAKTLRAYKAQNPSSDEKEYELQRLVPTEDFALRHWMVTTFHMINYAPQHKSKVSLWNAINSHVHDRVVQAKLKNDKSGVTIYTGTWGELKDADGNIQFLGNDKQEAVTIPLLWWKLIDYIFLEYEMIVVIMHNVDGLEKICQEVEGACDLTQWSIELNENISNIVYCCDVKSAMASIPALSDLDIIVEEYTGILHLD